MGGCPGAKIRKHFSFRIISTLKLLGIFYSCSKYLLSAYCLPCTELAGSNCRIHAQKQQSQRLFLRSFKLVEDIRLTTMITTQDKKQELPRDSRKAFVVTAGAFIQIFALRIKRKLLQSLSHCAPSSPFRVGKGQREYK